MISQYPHAITIPDSLPTDFTIEDPLNSSGVSDSSDNATTLENTTAAPSDFAINTTEENMTGRGAREQGTTGDFALQIPQGVSDLLQNTSEPGAVATDFGDDESNRFELNTRKIAKELIGYTLVEISRYPLNDLSVNDIEGVLSFLNPSHLAKVLLNIPEEDLREVKNRLSPTTFNQTIDRLSVENRTQVEDRLSVANNNITDTVA